MGSGPKVDEAGRAASNAGLKGMTATRPIREREGGPGWIRTAEPGQRDFWIVIIKTIYFTNSATLSNVLHGSQQGDIIEGTASGSTRGAVAGNQGGEEIGPG